MFAAIARTVAPKLLGWGAQKFFNSSIGNKLMNFGQTSLGRSLIKGTKAVASELLGAPVVNEITQSPEIRSLKKMGKKIVKRRQQRVAPPPPPPNLADLYEENEE